MTEGPGLAALATALGLHGADLGVGTVVLQSRGVGVGEALRSLLPEPAVTTFAALTVLGDSAVLLVLAALVYLVYGRRAGGFVAGVLFAGYAVVIALKAAFALPRPPTELHVVAVSGYGFPSGHAVAATVGWGALAVTLEGVLSTRLRTAGAATAIAAVAISRVVIGVHYLVDVLAGVGIGLIVLGAAVRWGRYEPLALFGLAGGLAGVAVAASGAVVEAVALLGACAGALVAWPVVDHGDCPSGRPAIAVAVGAGILILAVVAAVAPAASLLFVAGAATTAGVVMAPVAASQWLDG